STVCFAKYPLERALRHIAELEFGKVDVTIHEKGPHLKPSEVAADIGHAAQRLRVGPGLVPAAFSVDIEADDPDEFDRQLRAVCRLARVSAVPWVSVPAGPAAAGLDAEVRRLTRLAHVAEAEGIMLTVPTETGTLTEDPDAAVALCERVPGLGLALDPSPNIPGAHHGKRTDHVAPY